MRSDEKSIRGKLSRFKERIFSEVHLQNENLDRLPNSVKISIVRWNKDVRDNEEAKIDDDTKRQLEKHYAIHAEFIDYLNLTIYGGPVCQMVVDAIREYRISNEKELSQYEGPLKMALQDFFKLEGERNAVRAVLVELAQIAKTQQLPANLPDEQKKLIGSLAVLSKRFSAYAEPERMIENDRQWRLMDSDYRGLTTEAIDEKQKIAATKKLEFKEAWPREIIKLSGLVENSQRSRQASMASDNIHQELVGRRPGRS